jgi:tRNA threonylcarbamoyladenosine biosynthesis protein TsaB
VTEGAAGPRILAVDTTEDACSAALLCDGAVSERFELAPRQHSELLLPMIQALLGEAGLSPTGLNALAFACGPGSFTGLRIAAATVQGIALATARPVIAVSSLRGLAQGAWRQHRCEAVYAAFDARMGEVYWGVFRVDAGGIMRAVDAEAVCAPSEVSAGSVGDACAVGSGWATHAETLRQALGAAPGLHADARVHAADIAVLAADEFAAGRSVGAVEALPVYLRDDVAQARR